MKNKLFIKMMISIIFTIPLLAISVGHILGVKFPDITRSLDESINFVVIQMLFCVPVIISGYSIYRKGISDLLKLKPTKALLILISTIAAIAYGFIVVIKIKKGYAVDQAYTYVEAIGLTIMFINIGMWVRAKSISKTSKHIQNIINNVPKEAIVIENGKKLNKKIKDIKLNEIIYIEKNQIFPLDGEIIEGSAIVDQSMITGESMLVKKTVGDNIVSATINKQGTIKYKVTNLYESTTLSQIVNMIDENNPKNSNALNLEDFILSYYFPMIFLIAIFAAIYWFIITRQDMFALNIFVSVLVIASPCAIGIAIPMTTITVKNNASKKGILIKYSNYLQTIANVDTIIFDKTGTITEGIPIITDIINNKISQNDLISIAASMEEECKKILYKSIVQDSIINKAEELRIPLRKVSSISAIEGAGLLGIIESKNVLLGNKKLMVSQNVELGELSNFVKRLENEGKSVLFLAINNKISGIIGIADVPRNNSRRAIDEIKNMGIKVVMLTGDNERTSKAIAHTVGIDEVIFEVLPNDKMKIVENLKQKGERVAMVGDGVNDTLALMKSDIGIAIGTGAQVAVESSDVVLLKNDLLDVVRLIKLGKITVKNIKQNLFLSFIYNIIGIIFAIGFFYPYSGYLLNPIVVLLSITLSSLTIFFNILKLKRMK